MNKNIFALINLIIELIIKKLKKRWKYYAICYFFGFIISIKSTGIPNYYYLIPIKAIAVFLAVLFGNAFYYKFESVPIFEAVTDGFISISIVVIFLIIVAWLKTFLETNYGVDITPFIGYGSKIGKKLF